MCLTKHLPAKRGDGSEEAGRLDSWHVTFAAAVQIVNCQLGHVAWDYATMKQRGAGQGGAMCVGLPSGADGGAQSVGHAGQGQGNNSLVFTFCRRCRKSFCGLYSCGTTHVRGQPNADQPIYPTHTHAQAYT